MARRTIQIPPNCDLTLGMRCIDKSVDGRSVWQMEVDERFENPAGIMQGGFLTAFVDSVMGAAAVTTARDRKVFVANVELKISFMAPVLTGSTITCTAEVVSGGARVAFVEATVVDEESKLLARATSTYLIRERK